MKTNELMVGDWVKVTDDDIDDSFIGQVKAIDELENINVPEGEAVAYPYSIDCLEPIPLTPEILEKNGFVPDNFSPYYLLIEDGSVRFSEHQYGLYCNILRSYQRYDGVCNYVHQLQHALRLCGIEKEIIL